MLYGQLVFSICYGLWARPTGQKIHWGHVFISHRAGEKYIWGEKLSFIPSASFCSLVKKENWHCSPKQPESAGKAKKPQQQRGIILFKLAAGAGMPPSSPPMVFHPLEASVLHRSHLFCTDLQMTWGRNPTGFFAALWHTAKAPTTSSHLFLCMKSYLP